MPHDGMAFRTNSHNEKRFREGEITMCGIGGLAAIGGNALTEEADAVLHAMARALAHRGPDAEKLSREGPVGLVFQRLSLVDPVGGGQPLSTDDGQLVLIANGEVYNHRELEAGRPMRTGSDCEVLLHLYRSHGLRFLDNVLGMFAVVLWDKARHKLIFARDRFGIKPLFYTRVGDRLAFASEIKTLLGVPGSPRRVDWQAALTDQNLNAAPVFSHAPLTTWFEGIHSVPAATIIEIDLRTGEQRSHRFWRLPFGHTDASDREFVTAYRDLLAESTRMCGTADAEIGLFLSGGIDSAAVAAFTPHRDAVHTFTALNGSTVVNGDARHAHLVAASLGMPHHQVLFEPDRVPSKEEWRRLLWLLETPLCGPEQWYKYEMYRYAKQVRPQLRAMMLGQGADEFNGGYSVEVAGGGGWEDFIANLAGMARTTALRHKPALAPWWREDRPMPLADDVLDLTGDPYDAYAAWKYRDIQQYNCWHEDRTAAGNGVEARVPFLDHRIIELMASVPPERRQELLWDKSIAREAMRGLLPPDIITRPKVPFFYGGGERHTYRTVVAMLGDGELVEEALSSPRARRYLNADGIRRMLDAVLRDPAAGEVELLLRLVNIGLLENLTAALPPPFIDTPRAVVARGLTVDEWEPRRMEALTIPAAPPIGTAGVPALAEPVMLLRAQGEEGIAYLAVHGVIEYVADGAWLEFLSQVDGVRSVEEILEATGIALDDISEPLADALEVGVLALSPVAVVA